MGRHQRYASDRSHRSGKKSSSSHSRKHGASLPQADQEPYHQMRGAMGYPHDNKLMLDLAHDSSGVVYLETWQTTWEETTCYDEGISVFPQTKECLNPDLLSGLTLGFTNLQLGEAPRPSMTVTYPLPRYREFPKTKYTSAHVLILTWSFHDLRGGIDPNVGHIIVSLEEETIRLRDTFEAFGYQVHEHRISMEGSADRVRSAMKEFLSYADDETLLLVYYHGHGGLDDEGELVFSSHEHPSDAQVCQEAASDLYQALTKQESASKLDRSKIVKSFAAQYERFRPIAEVKWEEIRSMILRAPCDLLLILDCCAAGGANLRHVNWQPGRRAEGYAKHLYAACGFESSSRGDMTAGLCDVLDEYAENGEGMTLTTKRLHQIVEDRLQKKSLGPQPIFKQLLPLEEEQTITLPMFPLD